MYVAHTQHEPEDLHGTHVCNMKHVSNQQWLHLPVDVDLKKELGKLR